MKKLSVKIPEKQHDEFSLALRRFGLTGTAATDLLQAVALRGVVAVEEGVDDEFDGRKPKEIAARLHNRIRSLPRPDLLRAFEETLRFYTEQPGSPLRNFLLTMQYLRRYGTETPSRILEVGSNGDVLGQAIACALHGIRFSTVALAPGPLFQPEDVRHILATLGLGHLDLKQTLDRCEFEQDFVTCGMDGPFDLIYAHVVLEHVVDLPGFLRRVYDLLAPAGRWITVIDLADHRHTAHPLAFLAEPEDEWQKTRPSLARRTRNHEYLRSFYAAGFECSHRVCKAASDVPADVQVCYPGIDLTPLTVEYICRKREDQNGEDCTHRDG